MVQGTFVIVRSLAVITAQLPLPARGGVQHQAPCHAVLARSHTEMQFRVRTLSLRAVVTSHQPRSTFWRLVVALRTQHKGLEGSRQERKKHTMCTQIHTMHAEIELHTHREKHRTCVCREHQHKHRYTGLSEIFNFV